MITMQLVITVKYDENGETEKALKGMLYKAADYLAGEGMLSGNSDAEVDTWSVKVETVSPMMTE